MHVATYNERTAVELAELADEAVRGINHLTIDGSGLACPADLYRTLGSLTSMTYRMQQAFSQLDRRLQQWLGTDQLRIDGGDFAGDPAGAAHTASQRLARAASSAEQTSRAIAGAQSAIAWAAHQQLGSVADRSAN